MKKLLPLLVASLALSGSGFAADPATVVNADTALTTLKHGNATFAANPVSAPKQTEEARTASVNGQHPIAVIVTC